MNGEASLAFVDTNILVYAFADDDPHRHELARRLVTKLTEEGSLRLSTHVLQEFFMTVTSKARKRLTPEEAIQRMDYFSEWPIYPADYSAIREAAVLAGRAAISLWTALVVVAASRSGATVVYTEELKHGQKLLGVQIVNPFK